VSCGDFSTRRERVALGSELRSKNKEDERTKTERKQRERERKRKSNLSFETKLIKLALHLKYISEFTTTTTTTAATNYYTIPTYFLTFFTPTTNSIYFDCVDDFQQRILLYSFFSIFGFVLILLLLLPVKRWLC